MEIWRTKLMFVGLGGAGKTRCHKHIKNVHASRYATIIFFSLLKALMSSTHTTQQNSTEKITDGIDIQNWVVQTAEGPEITYNTWDFAGQTVYYNTHQFFMSRRAIYLLLWTTRLGYEHSGLDFWLNSIQCHAPNAPIFVIGTHSDQVSNVKYFSALYKVVSS
jgi:GTPase SAR1 family protein